MFKPSRPYGYEQYLFKIIYNAPAGRNGLQMADTDNNCLLMSW